MSIANNWIQLAVDEIYLSYRHRVRVDRKTLRKYGRNVAVGTTEVDITTNSGTETFLTTNAIDTISSSDSADTSKSIYIEGMTISGGVLTFATQTATTDASDGQTKVTLSTPLARVTRMRGATTGNVYVYENTSLTAGKPTDTTKIHNTLVAGDNTSLKAGTSIAGNNYFILTHYWATMGRAGGNAAADIRFKISNLGDSVLGNNFFTDEVWSISLNSPLDQQVRPFEIIKPNSDLVMTATGTTTGLTINAGFMGFFADIISDEEWRRSEEA